MLLAIRNIHKTYGALTVLRDINFVVNATDRIGIVGANGAGKSTLLRIVLGQEEADSGMVSYAPSVEVGYLPQSTPSFYGRSIQDLLMEAVGHLRQLEEQMHQLEMAMTRAATEQLPKLLEEYQQISTRFQDRGGYELDHKIDSLLTGLRIDYLPRAQAVEQLSGGEKARVNLAALLLRSPDLLLLDEPTNHLDFASMDWLERYLTHYSGALLMVSHDRQFLNRTVTQIFEIDEQSHGLQSYSGNYDAYMQAKAAERLKWEQDYERQQEEMKELRKRIKETARSIGHSNRTPRDNDKFARHFFAQNAQSASASAIRAAEVQLQRLEEQPIPKPPALTSVNSSFRAQPLPSHEIISLAHVSKRFDRRQILRDISLLITSRARIMLIGANGAGKTTLLRLIMGQEQPDSGSVQVAGSARIGYLAQEPETLDLTRTVIESYRADQVGYEGEMIGRLLGYGLFHLEDMHKQGGQLSLGQRRKLELARLMAQEPNVLLLDEPTNYISLDVLEAFEAAILAFPGPVLAISHDRWFIQRFGGEIWYLQDGQLLQEASNREDPGWKLEETR